MEGHGLFVFFVICILLLPVVSCVAGMAGAP